LKAQFKGVVQRESKYEYAGVSFRGVRIADIHNQPPMLSAKRGKVNKESLRTYTLPIIVSIPTGLEDQHGMVQVLRQTTAQYKTGLASADNDEIVRIRNLRARRQRVGNVKDRDQAHTETLTGGSTGPHV
jgi:hypothetical protein